jgi:hypothetical protein
VNGTCVNSLYGYQCDCDTGYDGVKCDHKTDWCSSFPCTNLATCISSDTDFKCVCLPGYTGPNCECLYPSLDCSDLPDGNYPDPCLVCANNFYQCAGGNLWNQVCPANLYFDSVSNTCLKETDVPACNLPPTTPSFG